MWMRTLEYVIITAIPSTEMGPDSGPSAAALPGGVSGRRLDAALAVCAAIVPLLPTGPRYAGLPAFAYVDLVVVALLAFWVWERLRRRRPPAASPPSIRAWHLTLAAVLGSALFSLAAEHRLGSPVFLAMLRDAGELFWPLNHSTHPLYALRVALTFVEGWLIFVLVVDVCRRAPDPRRRGRALLGGWLAGFALVSAFALVQYATRFQLHPYWVRANPNIVRSHSTLDDPNALGAYLVLGIGLLAGLLWLDGRRRRLWLPLLVLGTTALWTTMSRAAIGAAVLAPLIVLAFVPEPRTRAQRLARVSGRLVIASVLIVLAGSATARLFISEHTRTQPANAWELIVKTVDPRESLDWVLRGRLAWWDASFSMFRESPLTGVGLGRVPRLMGAYGGGRIRENTHNLYLQMFAEAGALGGLAFIGLAAGLCAALARTLREATLAHSRGIALGGLIGTVGFLLTLLTGHTLLLASGQILFAAFVGAVLCAARWDDSGTAVSASRRTRGFATARLAAACLVVAACYPAAAWGERPSRSTGPWGYAWGLHGQEQAGGGVTYRWTKAHALMDVDVPTGTSQFELAVAAPTPIRDGRPVRLRVTAAGLTRELTLRTPDVHTIMIPFEQALPSSGRLTVDVRVEPTFVPAHVDPQSSDRRELGVQLLRPHFVTSGSHTDQ